VTEYLTEINNLFVELSNSKGLATTNAGLFDYFESFLTPFSPIAPTHIVQGGSQSADPMQYATADSALNVALTITQNPTANLWRISFSGAESFDRFFSVPDISTVDNYAPEGLFALYRGAKDELPSSIDGRTIWNPSRTAIEAYSATAIPSRTAIKTSCTTSIPSRTTSKTLRTASIPSRPAIVPKSDDSRTWSDNHLTKIFSRGV